MKYEFYLGFGFEFLIYCVLLCWFFEILLVKSLIIIVIVIFDDSICLFF